MTRLNAVAVAALLALAGCSSAQWQRATAAENNPEYHAGTEILHGRGLFTGKKGEWQLAAPDDLFGSAPAGDPDKPRKIPINDR